MDLLSICLRHVKYGLHVSRMVSYIWLRIRTVSAWLCGAKRLSLKLLGIGVFLRITIMVGVVSPSTWLSCGSNN